MSRFEDDCECDILEPNERIKHIKCKFFKLMSDQVRKTSCYLKCMPCKRKSRSICRKLNFTKFFKKTPWYLYGLAVLVLMVTVLIVGAYWGVAICGNEQPRENIYGVF